MKNRIKIRESFERLLDGQWLVCLDENKLARMTHWFPLLESWAACGADRLDILNMEPVNPGKFGTAICYTCASHVDTLMPHDLRRCRDR